MPLQLARTAIMATLAVVANLSDADLGRAIAIAKASDPERAHFHAAYVGTVRDPIIERLEVITEFRRAVLLGEERYRRGDRMFGAKQIREMLQPWAGGLTIHAELKFHPQNAYVHVPDYDIILGGPGADEIVGVTTRDPIFQTAAPVSRGHSSSIPILGANIDAQFEAASVTPHPTLVRLVLDGKIAAMTTFDFGRLD